MAKKRQRGKKIAVQEGTCTAKGTIRLLTRLGQGQMAAVRSMGQGDRHHIINKRN